MKIDIKCPLTPKKLLVAPVALGVLLSASIAKAADDAPLMTSMDHSAIAGGGMSAMTMGPPPPASLNWTSVAGAGQFMLGYTPTFMGMSGNYIGTSKVSDSTIATTIPSGQTHSMMMMGKMVTMPTMLRIVPDSMDGQMHMFNAMYGVTENLTIMAMTGYVEKSMSMTTFKGMMGSTVLGTSSGTTDGITDTMVGAELPDLSRRHQQRRRRPQPQPADRLANPQHHHAQPDGQHYDHARPLWHANGLRLGDARAEPRLFRLLRPLVLGPRLSRLLSGRQQFRRLSLGRAQRIPRLGRLYFVPERDDHDPCRRQHAGPYPGRDSQIMGLSQNANPLYYGGQMVRLLGGVEIGGAAWGYAKSSLSVEAGGPIYQNLNGPQFGQSWQVTVSARVMF